MGSVEFWTCGRPIPKASAERVFAAWHGHGSWVGRDKHDTHDKHASIGGQMGIGMGRPYS